MQKLQNLALRKILKAFRTSPIAIMKIEANILSVEIRLNQKMQKLALRIMKMKKTHFTKLRTSSIFRLNQLNEIEKFEEDIADIDRNSKFKE